MSSATMTPYSPTHNYIDATNAEQAFRQSFDLEDPVTASESYARRMHMHTMQQLETAARSANRRASAAGSAGSLSSESSMESEQGDL